MRRKIQFLIVLLSVPLVFNAQTVDDDMYFVPSKNKVTETKTTVSKTTQPTTRQTLRVPVSRVDTVADYHTGALRDVDDYNRRGTKMAARLEGDTLYLDNVDERETPAYRDYDHQGYYDDYGYYDDDYIYSSRLMRYRGYHFYDPFMWDFCYGWYDPWYDPWYGWYGPYYRHGFYSWYDWGWGWHHRPGWDLGWYHGWYPGGYYGYHYPHHRGYIYSNGGRRLGSGSSGYASRAGSRGGRVSAPTRSRGAQYGTRGSLSSDRMTTRQSTATRGSRGNLSSDRESVARGSRGTINRQSSTSSSRSSNSTTTRTTTQPRSSSSSASTRSSSSSSGGFSGGSRGGGFSGGGGGLSGGGNRGGGGRGGR